MDVQWADQDVRRTLMSQAALLRNYGSEMSQTLSRRLQHLRVVDELAELGLLGCPCSAAGDLDTGHVAIPVGDDHELLLDAGAAADDWRGATTVTVIGVRPTRGCADGV